MVKISTSVTLTGDKEIEIAISKQIRKRNLKGNLKDLENEEELGTGTERNINMNLNKYSISI